jgi:imidazoleglycerol phosphate dehydratase HisB
MLFQNVVRLSQIKKKSCLIMSMSIKCQINEKITVIMLVLPESKVCSVSQYARISQNRQVFQLFFANHHKIPQNFKSLTFDLKTAQKVQNRKNLIKKLVS